MGYFANLYVVEVSASANRIEMSTCVFGAAIGRAYFCWGGGTQPRDLHAYARNTIFCDTPLQLLPGYPRVQDCEDPRGEHGRCLIEASFQPRHGDDPVLFHFLLPTRFLPRRDLQPLVQPQPPFISLHENRLAATYPVVGRAEFRFKASRLNSNESFNDYDMAKILHPEGKTVVKAEVEFNFGVFKIKLA